MTEATHSNIQELSLEAVMGERFGRYSKYIIQERALPDIRDGLKSSSAESTWWATAWEDRTLRDFFCVKQRAMRRKI